MEFTNMSNNFYDSRPETMAPAPEVSPSSWKFLEVMVTPTFSMIFHDYRNCDSGSRGLEMVEKVGFANTVHRCVCQNSVTEICD